MKQLIARIDDLLHERLKALAARQGRSVNAVVTDVLTRAVAEEDPRAEVRERLRRAELLVAPSDVEGRGAPAWDELAEATRGSGPSLSEALERDRSVR